MEKYIPELEGLRSLLAWWVVLGHIANFSGFTGGADTPVWLLPILRTGVPVHVFIILSGFVIFFLLDRDPRYGKFMLGRLFRIYPVYLLCFVLTAALFHFLQEPLTEAYWIDPALRAEHAQRLASIDEHWWQHVLLHLTLLHGLLPDQVLPHSGHAILGPAWSLSLEWQFYLLAPLLLVWLRRAQHWALLTAIALLVVKAIVLRTGLTFSFGAFLPMKIEYFLLGIGTFFAFKCSGDGEFSWWPWVWLGAGIVVAFVAMVFTGGVREHFFAVSIWAAVIVTAVLRMRGWQRGNVVAQLLRTHTARYFGKISYPTYLVHVVVIDFIGAWLVRLLPSGWTRLGVFALLLVPALLATWGASQLLHRWIEAPAMRYGKNRPGRALRSPAATES